jgi:predicted amidohydrolase
MQVGIVQTRPVLGDIERNITMHKKSMNRVAAYGTATLIFPELSLTGYEPTLAKDLAMEIDDIRLDAFQGLSDRHRLTMGVGVPLKTSFGIAISLLILQPGQPRKVYTKRYLHPDEEAFFVSGQGTPCALGDGTLALAICHEIFVSAHVEAASENGAQLYLASVAKTAGGVAKAEKRLSTLAKEYGMVVLVANCVGPCNGEVGGGKSAIWNNRGELIGQLNDTEEGVLLFDTESGLVQKISV